MAEWSKAPDLSSGTPWSAWVRTPLGLQTFGKRTFFAPSSSSHPSRPRTQSRSFLHSFFFFFFFSFPSPPFSPPFPLTNYPCPHLQHLRNHPLYPLVDRLGLTWWTWKKWLPSCSGARRIQPTASNGFSNWTSNPTALAFSPHCWWVSLAACDLAAGSTLSHSHPLYAGLFFLCVCVCVGCSQTSKQLAMSPADQVDNELRLSALIQFKNSVVRFWRPTAPQ